VLIERERRIMRVDSSRAEAGTRASGEALSRERDEIRLDRVSASTIESEARALGLQPQPRLQIAATDEHVGSVVVVLSA
jgi:hypothetical protein